MNKVNDTDGREIVGHILASGMLDAIFKVLGELPANRVYALLRDLEKSTKPIFAPKVDNNKNDNTSSDKPDNSDPGTTI